MVNLLLAAALAAVTPQPATDPAMFAVRDADTTIYIFGTFHALDGQTDWFQEDVREAFEQSNELVLETLIPEGPRQQTILVQPVAAPSVTPSGSFLATTRMAISAGRSKGMQVNNGADMVLRHIAETEGKPVEGLEPLEYQLAMFNHLPPPQTAPAPKAGEPVAANPMDSLSKAMTEMQAAWKRGDQTVFVRMLDQLRHSSPDTYRMMFTERNAHWADWIEQRMKSPGTVFVAVGAGHLAGKDSLLVRLAEKGIESQRVN